MSETNETITLSLMDKVKSYVTSKKMIYLCVALGLCVAIYFYMNKNKKQDTIEKTNMQQEPEIILSNELVENLYRNNSNPIAYLHMLQQQGQIPQGPLPKIVLDYSVNQQVQQQQMQQQQMQQQQMQQQQMQQQQMQQQNLQTIKEVSSVASDDINLDDINESQQQNTYQKIDDDEEDDIINQKLTKEEIEKINRKILNNQTK